MKSFEKSRRLLALMLSTLILGAFAATVLGEIIDEEPAECPVSTPPGG